MGPNPIEAQLDDAFGVERHHLVDEASRRKRRDVFFVGGGEKKQRVHTRRFLEIDTAFAEVEIILRVQPRRSPWDSDRPDARAPPLFARLP